MIQVNKHPKYVFAKSGYVFLGHNERCMRAFSGPASAPMGAAAGCGKVGTTIEELSK